MAMKVSECENCGEPVDHEIGIYDGATWFCNPRCHGLWITEQAEESRHA